MGLTFSELLWASIGNSLQGELNTMIENMESHSTEVDRIAGIEHMYETHEIKMGTRLLLSDNYLSG